MRHLLASCLLLAIALPCQAQGEKPKPNTLTPKEIADGWILLFDGETTFGWTGPPGSAKVTQNALDLSGAFRGRVQTTCFFGDFELHFEYQLPDGVGLFTVNSLPAKAGFLISLDVVGGWKPCKILLQDQVLWFEQQGRPLRTKWPHAAQIHFERGAGCKELQIRNVKIRPTNTRPLFNSKDLTGWKEFPGKKSKFAVIEGAINVTNGPGDLQTVGKYKDFVLQLECKSNGKHLNSGIFFRCRDNEYQNGYEAQIRNEFTDKPTQKYLIEEYDPKTNKLLGKKEQLFTAVDFGTGAIYRRQPARKQMSKDGEWFGMTIVAHGNHLATWVNGVQVTDWTDNRPKSDNARTGCKLEPGHISIQGHDPTTNLSFRNLRIAEFK